MAEEMKEQKDAQAAEAAAIEPSEFDKLLKKEFKPKTDHAREAIDSAVRTLAEQALSDTALVSDDSVRTIEAIIAEIDRKLSEQINMIMHHEDFQSLEGSWRGMHHLVNRNITTGSHPICNCPERLIAFDRAITVSNWCWCGTCLYRRHGGPDRDRPAWPRSALNHRRRCPAYGCYRSNRSGRHGNRGINQYRVFPQQTSAGPFHFHQEFHEGFMN